MSDPNSKTDWNAELEKQCAIGRARTARLLAGVPAGHIQNRLLVSAMRARAERDPSRKNESNLKRAMARLVPR